MDDFAVFKPHSDADYSIRIDEISGSSTFIVGSVVQITSSGDITFNAGYSTTQITNLNWCIKITLVANLSKDYKLTAVANSDEVYVITGTRHYFTTR